MNAVSHPAGAARIRALSVLLALVLLGGCWDAKEMEYMQYALVMGIDVDEQDGRTVVYVENINFASMPIPEGGQRTAKEAEQKVIMGKGSTVTSAFHDLYTYAQRRIYWGHLSAIIFSERALQQNLYADVLEVLGRYNEVRRTVYVYVTKEPLGEIMTTPPALPFSTIFGLLSDPDAIYEQSARVSPIRLHRFISHFNEPGKAVIIPYIGTVKNRWTDDQGTFTTLLLNGIGILQDKQFKGFLLEEDIVGIRWLQPSTVRAPLNIRKGDTIVATLIIMRPKVRVQPEVKGEQIRFKVKVTAQGQVLEMKQDLGLEEVNRLAAQAIESQIETTYAKGLELDADLLDLAYHVYRQDPQLWKRLAKEGRLTVNPNSVQVQAEVNIKQSGANRFHKILHPRPD
ncbi:Ger(x)C family spore germination protein [Caldalkalibacillus thermarum]|uniref:Ger(x)C family spore germination protein n=1 Tax=Caldalkalibacillus thermarum TaxID=296745 RepID=UPI0016667AD1|nr:Ger(x)C family spore germination protein [Caldalkalibacillus thermarum]